MDNFMKMCQQKNMLNSSCGGIQYNKIATGGNNPNISKNMKYAQRVNSVTPKKITYAEYAQMYGIPTPPPTPPQKNNRLFMTFFF